MNKLKEMRLCKNMSQSKLAEASSVKYRMIQNYEQGENDLTKAKLETILRLCVALQCHLGELFEDAELLEKIKEYEKIPR